MPPIQRPTAPRPDLTSKQAKVNPAKLIHDNYDSLMSIGDPETLKQHIINLIKPTVNHGLSQVGFQKFVSQLNQAAGRGVEGIQFYLTNYMLKAANLGVNENKIDAIATLISESSIQSIPLTNEQRQLKLLAESYGFHVSICEGVSSKVESYVFHQTDGPVTEYVAFVRTLELVAKGMIGPDEAAEFMMINNIVNVRTDGGVDADSPYIS